MGFRVWDLGFGFGGSEFRVWGSGFGVWGLGFRVRGLGFRAVLSQNLQDYLFLCFRLAPQTRIYARRFFEASGFFAKTSGRGAVAHLAFANSKMGPGIDMGPGRHGTGDC